MATGANEATGQRRERQAPIMSTTKSNGRLYTVHKEGHEGILTVDVLTGKIITEPFERPEWAEGLAAAVPQERLHFYETRLGKDAPEFKAIEAAEVVNAEDLGWIGVDAEQTEIELFASDEFRMDTISKAMGLDRDTGIMDTAATAEREVSRENKGRTAEEIAALESSLETGFSGLDTRTQHERARASGGSK